MVIFSKSEEIWVVETVLQPRNYQLIGNPSLVADVNKKKKAFWESLAEKLNAKNLDVKKTGKQVSTCWNNARNRAKGKWAAMQLHKAEMLKTGGGPPPPEPKPPTQLEQLIIEALKGTASFSGLDGVDTGTYEEDRVESAGTPFSVGSTDVDTESDEIVAEEEDKVKLSETEKPLESKTPISATPVGFVTDAKRRHKRQGGRKQKRQAAANHFDSEGEGESLEDLQREVLKGQKRTNETQEKAALQQIEVQTAQLKMLEKMSTVLDQIDEKVQILVNLQQFDVIHVDQLPNANA